MGNAKYPSTPWKLESNEKFKLPWYTFLLFFLDRKLYHSSIEKARQINQMREKDKEEKFKSKKLFPCPPPRLYPQYNSPWQWDGKQWGLPMNSSKMPMPPVSPPKQEHYCGNPRTPRPNITPGTRPRR
jgi:hypothetical protein